MYDTIINQAKLMKMTQWSGFELGLLQGKSSDLPRGTLNIWMSYRQVNNCANSLFI